MSKKKSKKNGPGPQRTAASRPGGRRRFGIDEKYVFFALLALFILLLIPMLLIARYDVPCVDDYGYGNLTHHAWVQSRSLWQVFKAAASHVKARYYSLQGSFAAIFLFTLQPAVFGEQWYFLTPFIMLLALICGVVCLCRQTMQNIIGASKYRTGIVTLVVLILCTQLLPSPPEGFYWFNGSVYYTFFFGLSLILYARLLAGPAVSRGRTVGRTAALSVLGFLIGGGNLVTGLMTAIFFGCLLLYRIIRRDKRGLLYLSLPLVCFAAGFLINILAPGNAVRMADLETHPSMPETVLLSLRTAGVYIRSWLNFPLICLMLFLVPFLYKMAAASKMTFRWPGLVAAFSYCLIAASFCPPLYSIDYMPSRLTDIIFYSFVLLLTFDLFYCLGWLHRRIWSSVPVSQACSVPFIAAAAVILVAGTALIQWPRFTSARALIQLSNGDAAAYYATAQERLEILRDENVADAVLPAYPKKPYVLYFDDITRDPSNWRNTAMKRYYDKNSVVLESQ